jgi:DNA phosphorothioation-dependent restriction protein DptG
MVGHIRYLCQTIFYNCLYEKSYLVHYFFGQEKLTEEETKELMDKVFTEFLDLDNHLAESKFLAGETMTIADVQVYNEVLSVTSFLRLKIDEYAHLHEWRDMVSKDPSISQIDKEFHEAFDLFRQEMEKKTAES